MRPVMLFADRRFVVLDKPAGLKVHPGPGGGPSVEDWFPALSRGRDGPWLVHRLDADTAGCLLVALRRTALHAAQAEFTAGRAGKTYWAIVTGQPGSLSGTVDLPLAKRSTASMGWRMHVDQSGQRAITDWRLLRSAGGLTWLELLPRTGRTHQIRVHCAALGCPLLGDAVYGVAGPPLHLLSRAIALGLDPPVAATADPPMAMQAAFSACGWAPGVMTPETRSETVTSHARSGAAGPLGATPPDAASGYLTKRSG